MNNWERKAADLAEANKRRRERTPAGFWLSVALFVLGAAVWWWVVL